MLPKKNCFFRNGLQIYDLFPNLQILFIILVMLYQYTPVMPGDVLIFCHVERPQGVETSLYTSALKISPLTSFGRNDKMERQSK